MSNNNFLKKISSQRQQKQSMNSSFFSSSSLNLGSSLNLQNQLFSKSSQSIKLSFYHRSYLLPFKLQVRQFSITPSMISYKKLQKIFKQIIGKQLLFLSNSQKCMIQNLNLIYLQDFIDQFKKQKAQRIHKDYMGESMKQHTNLIIKKKMQNLSKQLLKYCTFSQNKDKVHELISTKNIKNSMENIENIIFIQSNSNKNAKKIKELFIILKFMQRTFFNVSINSDTNLPNQIQFLQNWSKYFIILLNQGYELLRNIYTFSFEISQNFIFTLAVIESMLKLMKMIKIYDSKFDCIFYHVLNVSIRLFENFIKSLVFIWTQIHRFETSFNKNFQGQTSPQIIDGWTNFHIFKSSILIKLIQSIQLSIDLRRKSNDIKEKILIIQELKDNFLQQDQCKDKNNSIVNWLFETDQQIIQQQKSNSSNLTFQEKMSRYFKINEKTHVSPQLNLNKENWNQNINTLLMRFQQKSILQHLIYELLNDVQKSNKSKNYKNNSIYDANTLIKISINKNIHVLSSICHLIQQILERHNIKSLSQQQKAQGKNQLLLIITETIRFQLPELLKQLQVSIKQRKYKISETVIVKQILKCFEGSIFSFINQTLLNNLNQLQNQTHIIEIENQDNLPYFRVKQLIKYSRQTEDSFLHLSKSLLKCVKSLNQKYHQFRSGKIFFEKSSLQMLPANLRHKFIKVNGINKQGKDTQNFYQVESFNYEKYGFDSSFKSKVDIGVNVNLINYNSSNGFIQQRKNESKNQIQTSQTLKVRKLSLKIQQQHSLLNYNNQILKTNDNKLLKIYQQNQQLIKINTWYEQQLRTHEDKQFKLEGIISQLVNINKIKQERLFKKRKQLHLQKRIIQIKIQSKQANFKNATLISSKSAQKLQQLLMYRNSNNSMNRLSRDSSDKNQTRSRKKTNAQIRLINDLNKLTQSIEKTNTNNDFILPPPPPPPILQNNDSSNQNFNSLLPPPPPILPPLPSFLPPPPMFLPRISEQPFSNNSLQQDITPKIQMKNIGWNMIDVTKIPNSFWQNAEQVIFDEDDLINNFSKTPQNIIPTIIATKQKQMEKKSLLKPDRVKNVQIGLRKARLGYNSMIKLQEIFYKYNQQYFDEEIIQCIISLLPTTKQKQEFTDLIIKNQDILNWTLADYFFASITKIESYEERLKAINFKNCFTAINSELIQKINNFISFFEQLRNDQFLRNFLEHMLTIGNFLNKKTKKANAYGFKLDSIQKTYTLIGQDHMTSLFEYILRIIYEKREQLFNQYSDHSPKDPDLQINLVSLNIIEQDYKFITRQCQNLQQIIIYSRNADDNSSSYLLPFYIQVQEQINIMKKLIQFAHQKFDQVLSFYCQKMESQTMINFMKQFRKRVKQFLIQMQRKKQADNQKSRLSNALSMRYSKFSMI